LYSGGTPDRDRIKTCTRRVNSGESFPPLVAAGTCAWQPRAARVRAKTRIRKGLTAISTP
jgi:hypothetical protein